MAFFEEAYNPPGHQTPTQRLFRKSTVDEAFEEEVKEAQGRGQAVWEDDPRFATSGRPSPRGELVAPPAGMPQVTPEGEVQVAEVSGSLAKPPGGKNVVDEAFAEEEEAGVEAAMRKYGATDEQIRGLRAPKPTLAQQMQVASPVDNPEEVVQMWDGTLPGIEKHVVTLSKDMLRFYDPETNTVRIGEQSHEIEPEDVAVIQRTMATHRNEFEPWHQDRFGEMKRTSDRVAEEKRATDLRKEAEVTKSQYAAKAEGDTHWEEGVSPEIQAVVEKIEAATPKPEDYEVTSPTRKGEIGAWESFQREGGYGIERRATFGLSEYQRAMGMLGSVERLVADQY
ncbi:MAG TPA: hypothetical protein VMW52_08885, partial [Phycisphaerae bacterium]|nr:hypothetical protein [Phycisphaerae bacterium]